MVKFLRTEVQSWPLIAPIVMSLNVNKFSAGKVADDLTIELESTEWSDTFQSLKRLQLSYQNIGTTVVIHCNRSVLIVYYDIKIYLHSLFIVKFERVVVEWFG